MVLLKGKQLALGADGVSTNNVTDLAITTIKIANNAVTSAKVDSSVIIADGSNAFTSNQSLGNNRLTNLATPVDGTDAARRNDLISSISNTFNVSQNPGVGFYASVEDAVVAINAGTAPTATNRYLIKVWPGKYTSTSAITIPAWVGVVGSSKGLVQFQNDTTDLFVCSGNNWFSDFLIEGSATSTLYAFDCNGQSSIHIRNVDMLNNGGAARQKFLTQSGSSWTILTLERCIIDYYGTSGYACTITNSDTAARFCDVWVQECFFDAFQLTDFGGSFELFGVQDVRFWRSTIRGTDADNGVLKYHTGIRHNLGGVTGTPDCEVAQCNISGALAGAGGVSIYGEAGTNYTVDNSLLLNALTDGTSTIRFSDATTIYGLVGSITTINAGDTASAGVIDSASRVDHEHAVSTATAGATAIGDSATEGVATSLARSDHKHSVTSAAPTAVGTANAEGAATTFARSDHVHDSPAPTISNKNMTASVTASDGAQATATTVAATPALDSYVGVRVNGVHYTVGDGVKTTDCYFSGDSGTTARSISAIVSGDTLHWNGTITGFELTASDKIDFDYLAF